MRHTGDVLVIGAGIAGCAIAAAFAQQGRRVGAIERSLREPDRIVELLQPGGVAALSTLGLAQCLEGIEATPVEGYHLFWKDEQATFWFCPVPGGSKFTDEIEAAEKPFGRSFHRGKFVGRLRAAIAVAPNITLVEATALELLRDERTGAITGAVCSRNGGPREAYYAPLTILADGPTSNFRSQFTRHRPTARSRFWGLELINAELPKHGYAYGVLGAGPPILIYQTRPRETRVLIDIPDETHRRLQTNESVRNYIYQRVVPTDRPPPANDWMPSTRNTTPGLVMLGDASNMRHPISGSGMTVALKDPVLLAELLNPKRIPSFEDTEAVLKELRRFHWRRKNYSASLNILAQALYLLNVDHHQPETPSTRTL
ncbi:squalene epoxidase [Achaetomium macrosporum]|uniref:Squalene monooxygenase n=1 Tax=Achaetomium macrosporum TaxID=79813 RepID=A0AAN7C336_9PEZI|nr:squalene epoxidase [Achaetomium macrosporum]